MKHREIRKTLGEQLASNLHQNLGAIYHDLTPLQQRFLFKNFRMLHQEIQNDLEEELAEEVIHEA